MKKKDYSFLTLLIPRSPGRIKMSELTNQARLKDERETRKYLLIARINGELICSDNRGYFIPASDQEIAAYYRTARKRAITTLRSLKRVRVQLISAGVNVAQIEGRSNAKKTEP